MLYDMYGIGKMEREDFLREIAEWFNNQDVNLGYVAEKVVELGGTCRIPDLLPEGYSFESDEDISDAHMRSVLAAVEDRVKELYAIGEALCRYSDSCKLTAMEKDIDKHLIKGQLILFAFELGKSLAAGENNG